MSDTPHSGGDGGASPSPAPHDSGTISTEEFARLNEALMLYKTKVYEVEDANKRLNKQLDNLVTSNTQLQKEVTKYQDVVGKSKNKQHAAELIQENESLRRSMQRLQESCNEQNAALTSSLRSAQLANQTLTQELNETLSREKTLLKDRENDAEQLRKEIESSFNEELESLRIQLDAARHDLLASPASVSAPVDNADGSISETVNTVDNTENAKLRHEVSELQRRVSDLHNAVTAKDAQIHKLDKQLVDANAALSKSNDDIAALNDKAKRKQANFIRAEEDKEKAVADRTAVENKLNEVTQSFDTERTSMLKHIEELRVNMSAMTDDYHKMEGTMSTLRTQLQEAQSENKQLHESSKTTAAHTKSADDKIVVLTKLNHDLNNSLSVALQETSSRDAKIRVLETELDETKKRLQSSEMERKEFQDKVSNLVAKIKSADDKSKEVAGQSNVLQADLDDAKKKLQTSETERITLGDKVSALVKQIKTSEEKNKELSSQLASIQADFEELRKKLQASDSERITSNDKVFSLVKQNKASEEKNKDLANQITGLLADLEETKRRLTSSDADRTVLAEKVSSVSAKNKSIDDRNKELTNQNNTHVNELSTELKSVKSLRSDALDALSKSEATIVSLQNEITANKQQSATDVAHIRDEQTRLVAELETKIHGLEGIINDLKKSQTLLEHEISERKENAIKVERDLDEARELLIAVTDDFEHAKQQLQDKDETESKYDKQVATLQTDIQSLKDAMSKMSDDHSNKINELEAEHKAARKKDARLIRELQSQMSRGRGSQSKTYSVSQDDESGESSAMPRSSIDSTRDNLHIAPFLSPAKPRSETMSDGVTIDLLQQELNTMVKRIGALQEEKWNVENKAKSLEQALASLSVDMEKKSSVIQHLSQQVGAAKMSAITSPVKGAESSGIARDPRTQEAFRRMQLLLEQTILENIALSKK